MTTWEAERALRNALRTLKPEQGPRARRNALRRVRLALSAVRRAVERDWSVPEAPLLTPTERERAGHKRLTLAEKTARSVARARKLRLRGFTIASTNCIETMALARIKVIRVKDSVGHSQLWAPAWAYRMWQEGMLPGKIEKMKHDMQARKAWLAESTLRNAVIP